MEQTQINQNESIKEIAKITAIISEFSFSDLYKFNNSHSIGGYIFTAEMIAQWAIDFYEKNKDNDWKYLNTIGYMPKSKEFSMSLGEKSFLYCWDDVVLDYSALKFEEYIDDFDKKTLDN